MRELWARSMQSPGAVEFITSSTAVPVALRFHTVLTSSAGYPLDKTYYQTVKGMVLNDMMERRYLIMPRNVRGLIQGVSDAQAKLIELGGALPGHVECEDFAK